MSGGAGSVDFPTTPGAFDTLTDGSDAFVTKFNPAGSALVYSTFLGGSSSDGASGLALDGAGNAWVTGGTTSTDFPIIVGAADSTHNGMSDVFVSELNNTGSTLLYSTFLGGSDSEGGFDIAVDTSGGVYVTGHTFSLNYPTTAGAFDTVWNGDMLVFWGDAFVSKLGSVSSRRRRRRRFRPRRRCSRHRTAPAKRSRSISNGPSPPARRRTRFKSTIRAPSPRRSCASSRTSRRC